MPPTIAESYVRALISDPHRRAEMLATILDPDARQRMIRHPRCFNNGITS